MYQVQFIQFKGWGISLGKGYIFLTCPSTPPQHQEANNKDRIGLAIHPVNLVEKRQEPKPPLYVDYEFKMCNVSILPTLQ